MFDLDPRLVMVILGLLGSIVPPLLVILVVLAVFAPERLRQMQRRAKRLFSGRRTSRRPVRRRANRGPTGTDDPGRRDPKGLQDL